MVGYMYNSMSKKKKKKNGNLAEENSSFCLQVCVLFFHTTNYNGATQGVWKTLEKVHFVKQKYVMGQKLVRISNQLFR